MFPAYKPDLALREVPDLKTLSDICKSLEQANILQQKFQPPPSKGSSLEPGLVYSSLSASASKANDKTVRQSCGCQLSANKPNTQQPISSNGRSSIRCWRSNGTGHTQRECGRKMPFCHGCGKGNAMKPY